MSNQFILDRQKNKISIAGDIGIQDVRKVLAIIHDTVEIRGYSDFELDLSECTLAFSGAMLPICAHIIRLRATRIEVGLKCPKSERMHRLFMNTGWANFICPRDFAAPKRNSLTKQFPATQYKTHQEQEQLLNDILEKLLSVIPNFNRQAFAAVEWALNEISDNVINHSQSPIGGLLQLSVFDSSRHRIEFTVADAGIGVPETLRSTHAELVDDADALLHSVKSGVTRNATDFQGNGLYGTFEICRVGGGRFSLNAGKSALICSGDSVTARNESVTFSGTSVDALIDFSEPSLLERALAIDGKIHNPVDYIELRYEQDDLKSIPFKLHEQNTSFRSRLAGRPVRNKLENLVNACPGQVIYVDFHGISVISSSFADEVFGKLFAELGPMRFMQSIRLIGVSPTVQALIDRAITQRMQV